MTPELRQYYEDRLSMMGTKAWSDLMDDVQTMLKAMDTLSGVKPDNLLFKQGELNMMRWLLSLKDVSEKSYEELQREGDEGL